MLPIVHTPGIHAPPHAVHTTHTHSVATTQAQHQVKGGLLLDVVVSQGATILQLLAGEDEALLVWGDACEPQHRL
jgi:hypothetical protein